MLEEEVALGVLHRLLTNSNSSVALDTETNGEDCRDGRGFALGVAIAWRDTEGINGLYLPFRHYDSNYNLQRFLPLLQRLISTRPIIFHNAKFDLTALETLGLSVVETRFLCTMILCHLINENEPFAKSLDACTKHYLGNEAGGKHKDKVTPWVKLHGWGMLPAYYACSYATWDAVLALQLYEAIRPKLKAEQLQPVWQHKEKFINVLRGMENRGVRVDTDFCQEEINKGETAMVDVIESLSGLVPSRPTDLQKLLIQQLGLPQIYSPKTGNPTFNKEAMEEYEEELEDIDKPIAKEVLRYRGWMKSVSSNYRPYLDLLSDDGRLRCNYKMHGTKTGRLSCEKPNLQQIPRSSDKPWNGHLKRAFIPDPGYSLITFDYAQLEMRIGASVAREARLLQIFDADRDLFAEMAADLNVIRYDAKTLAYAIGYGAGKDKIAKMLKRSREESSQLVRNFHINYPALKGASDYATREVLRKKKIQTISGRYRHFQYASQAHKAWNSVMQGSAADVVEGTMIRLDEAGLNNNDCRMLLQVHDEIVFEIRDDLVAEVQPEIESVMIAIPGLTARMKVEGKTWGLK